MAEVQRELEGGPPGQRLHFETQQLTGWDSGLVTFLRRIVDLCTQYRITPDQAGLPDGLDGIVKLTVRAAKQGG